MGTQIASFATTLVAACIFAEFTSAGPFEKSPTAYAPEVNSHLEQARSDLRFQLDRCNSLRRLKCRYSSPRVTVDVHGRDRPPNISRIIIEADLLRDDPKTAPDAAVSDALITLVATMTIFDPVLQSDQREALVSSLTNSVLTNRQSQGNGIDAHYSSAFDQAADGLFVILITPKR
jgi:hypothetical protein